MRAARPVAQPARGRRPRSRGDARRPSGRVVRVERLPRAHPAPGGRRGRARRAIDRWGTGSGSARLIVGSRPVHHELEHALAEWKRAERAVLFSTGFAANLGVLTTFAGPDVLVCSDELNHASIIDGRRLARAPLAVYRHRDVGHLDELLRASSAPRALVVSESVFSMDGDVAPIEDLRRGVRAPRRAPGARRSARGARAPTSGPWTATSSVSARCRRRSARSAASSPDPSHSPTSS